jgi:hypothetical protein
MTSWNGSGASSTSAIGAIGAAPPQFFVDLWCAVAVAHLLLGHVLPVVARSSVRWAGDRASRTMSATDAQ